MSSETGTIKTISPDELRKRMENKVDIVLLDVRQPEEHEMKNIPGSLLIPLGELPAHLGELEQYKNREIIVYCRSGNRSAHACQFLSQQGFNTTNLSGGMLAW